VTKKAKKVTKKATKKTVKKTMKKVAKKNVKKVAKKVTTKKVAKKKVVKRITTKTIKISRRKKVHLSDSDVIVLMKTIRDLPDLKHLLDRFKLEMKRRTGKLVTNFKGKYSKPLLLPQ